MKKRKFKIGDVVVHINNPEGVTTIVDWEYNKDYETIGYSLGDQTWIRFDSEDKFELCQPHHYLSQIVEQLREEIRKFSY